jgi:hypothetical protein
MASLQGRGVRLLTAEDIDRMRITAEDVQAMLITEEDGPRCNLIISTL